MTMTTTLKTLRGYTTQARYYDAGNIALDADEQFVVIGYIALGYRSVKPVHRHANGQPVILLDGRDHLTVLVQTVDPAAIVPTEDEAWSSARRHG